MTPNSSRTLRLTFNPVNKGEILGSLTFTYIEDEEVELESDLEQNLIDDGVLRANSYSNARDLGVLQTVKLTGIGGVFGLQINDTDFNSEEPRSEDITIESTADATLGASDATDGENPPDPKSDPKAGVKIRGSRISMDYSKITTGTSSTKVFEIKNTGDTVIETMITNTEGEELSSTAVAGKNKRMSLRFSATKLTIEPRSSALVEVVVEVIF